MVTGPGEYLWSSYQINGLGKDSDLCTPHPEYLHLGKNASDRQRIYCEFVSHHVDAELLKEIRDKTHKGMAVGNDRFKEELETLTGRRLKSKKGVGQLDGERKQFNFTPTPFTIYSHCPHLTVSIILKMNKCLIAR